MVKLNKIYTRTGDKGTTGLVDGSRVAKSDARMVAIGDVDEANSAIGVAVVAVEGNAGHAVHAAGLRVIQNDLFDLGSDLATPISDAPDPTWALRIVASQVERLEQEIDRLNERLTPLDSFVLPGGSAGAAAVHLARAITRRAERAAVRAGEEQAINPHALTYLNRLSDLLFVLARVLNDDGRADVKWVPGASR
ncbi:cob(I)yrinic acid a,c-diamide adenosyltransferase [Sphingobium sufflavum]|uniref:cob(I)yrinic acid a,c-diamide adenosyltransferase n=1 Tax=Sphingobium sufflavum TaxID=1129547 RepID=UPI001F323106|nr:cob(I)yrinic acid a,c-diamide adenosyltransferase [Sphingobium sufflavum]MCE7797583.1 cob(I)yrinic acid a,c-diamide adenosyltransferase [Sphingobium sufflavum]